MNKYAFIFPGQGAQAPGMGKDLYDNSAAARNVFNTADEVLGYNISDLCFNGSEEDLKKTINSQPCILTVSIAAYEALREKCSINPVCAAGHSLGEYAAMYTAGVVDLRTVLLLISKRAELMNEAAEKSDGSMAAVLGLDNETVINVAGQLNNVYVANFNSPGQVVITGSREEINNSIDKFKAAGAKRVLPLAVSGAFHSPFMKDAGFKFKDFINQFIFNNANIPVYTNVDAEVTINAGEFQNKLPLQISSSVLWTQTINNIAADGITNFIEIGPGKVLAGLNKKINPELNTVNIYNWESLNFAMDELMNCKEKELI